MPVGTSALSNDASKFIQDALIERSEQLHMLPQFCEKVSLPDGNAKTAYFIKYNRTDTMVDKLTEGVTPAETAFTITQQSITVDQWGMFIALTDVGVVTTKHPVLNEALDLVADAVSRCQDYNIAEVLNAGASHQYYDGSRATRGAITSTDIFAAGVFNKARATLNDNGAPPRAGSLFIAVCGPQVEADIVNEATTVGSFTAAHQTNSEGNKKLEMGTVGDWLGFRVVRSNFMPKLTRLSTSGWTISDTTGGSLSGTVYYKITRKVTTRGFEEDIAAEANNAMTNNRLAFTAPSTSGYVYNIYAGSVTADANLYLVKENLAPSAIYNLDSLLTSGTNPPATPAASITIHPIYCFAGKAVDNVAIDSLTMKGTITPAGANDSDPLQQRRKVGAKYAQKAGVRDSTRVLAIELCSNF